MAIVEQNSDERSSEEAREYFPKNRVSCAAGKHRTETHGLTSCRKSTRLRQWCHAGCLCTIILACWSCGSPPPVPPPQKLTIFGLGLESGELLRQDAINEFSRETGIQVELIPTPGSSVQQLTALLDLFEKRSASPDIVVIDSIWPGTLQEHLVDLTPYAGPETTMHFPVLLDNNRIAGRLVGLPFYMNSGMLFYRADLLKAYGYVSAPRTWRELESAALRIQQAERRRGKKEFWGFVWQGAAYEGLTCNALEWQAANGGGRIIEENGTVTVNNPRTAEAMRKAAAWIGSISPPGVLAYTESDTLSVFASGNAAFMRHWSSAYSSIARKLDRVAVGISLLPIGRSKRAQAIGGFQLGVSQYSLNIKQAARLVLHLTSRKVQERRAVRRGFLPTYPDLYDDAEFATMVPQSRVLKNLSEKDWVLRPSSVAGQHYADVSRAYYRQIHAILSRQTPVQDGLQDLELSLQRVMNLQNVPAIR